MTNYAEATFHMQAVDMFTRSVLVVVAIVFSLIVASLAVVAIETVYLSIRRRIRTWRVRRLLAELARERRRR